MTVRSVDNWQDDGNMDSVVPTERDRIGIQPSDIGFMVAERDGMQAPGIDKPIRDMSKESAAFGETKFDSIAAAHVSAMLARLIQEHNSIIHPLMSEVVELRAKCGMADSQNLHCHPVFDTKKSGTNCKDDCAGKANIGLSYVDGRKYNQTIKQGARQSTVDKTTLHSRLDRATGDVDSRVERAIEDKDESKPQPKKEKKKLPIIQGFVMSHTFEVLTAVAIIGNTLVMCMQLQYNGIDLGHRIRRDLYKEPAAQAWPGADRVFDILDLTFNILFLVELLLRLYTYRGDSLRTLWMWFDGIIVTLGWVNTIATGIVGIDPTMIRLLRLVRLVRLMKIFKSMSWVDSLFLLVKAIWACVGALAWSILILITVCTGSALFLSQILHSFMDDDTKDIEVRIRVFNYFGTFSRAMLTMIEITLANWATSARYLFEHVHESTFLFFIFYRCLFCFCVLRVIAAVFIAETNRVLNNDGELTVMRSHRDQMSNRRKLRSIFSDVDGNRDGTITYDELDMFLQNEDLVQWLATVQMDAADFEKLFLLLEEDGVVNIEKVVRVAAPLRGPAKTVDLLDLFKFIHKMDSKLEAALGIIGRDSEQEAIYDLIRGDEVQQQDQSALREDASLSRAKGVQQ